MCLVVSLTGCSERELVNPKTEDSSPPIESQTDTDNENNPDGNDSIGYFMTMPNKTGSNPMGVDVLYFYTERSDIAPGTGKLSLYTTDDILISDIDCSDSSRVKKEKISDTDKLWTGWEDPSCITINLDKPLEGGDYYVTAEENCFIVPDTNIRNLAMDKTFWTFHIDNYGIEKEAYSSGDPLKGKTGDTATLNIRIGEPAVKAAILEYDEELISVSTEELTSDGSITVTYKKPGELFWVIGFYDKDGNPVNGLSYSILVTE